MRFDPLFFEGIPKYGRNFHIIYISCQLRTIRRHQLYQNQEPTKENICSSGASHIVRKDLTKDYTKLVPQFITQVSIAEYFTILKSFHLRQQF